jgi:protease IV
MPPPMPQQMSPMGGGGWGGPPMYTPGLAAARPGGAFLRIVLATLLTVILVDLIVLNFYFLSAGASAAGPSGIRQVLVAPGASDQTVAAIPITGLITADSAQQFNQFLSTAQNDPSVKAVVLEIDSPGGSASAADSMHHRLELFKSQTKADGRDVPVIVSMGGMAASGGYYVACGADYLFAQPDTITADIGVLLPRFNVSALLAKYGVKETTIVATGCDYKNLGSMFEPENPKATQYLQGLVDATFQQFKQVVLQGRGKKLPADTTDIFNGRAYIAADALKLGLIDKIGYRQDAYAYAKTLIHAPDARVVRYEPAPLLQQWLGLGSLFRIPGGQAHAPRNVLNINGVNFDLAHLTDLIAPRPMYLWRGN